MLFEGCSVVELLFGVTVKTNSLIAFIKQKTNRILPVVVVGIIDDVAGITVFARKMCSYYKRLLLSIYIVKLATLKETQIAILWSLYL